MKANCCTNYKLTKEFENLAKFSRIIGDDNRLRILCLLKKGEHCVCQIYPNLDLSQNLVSSHIKILYDFGLISLRQEGKRNYYSLNPASFKKYNLLLNNFLKKYE